MDGRRSLSLHHSYTRSRARGPWRSALVLAAALTASGVGGCAGGGAPIACGPGCLGLGWFVQREPETLQSDLPSSAGPRCIDLEGVGLLLLPGRCTLGYVRSNRVALSARDDAHVRLSKLEVFTGRRAEQYVAGLTPETGSDPVAKSPLQETLP